MRNPIYLTSLALAFTCASILPAQGIPEPAQTESKTDFQSIREDRESTRPSVYKDLKVRLESRDDAGLDVSRFTVESNWLWEMSQGAYLQVRAPYQSIETSRVGQLDADVSGMQDMQLTYYSGVPDDDRSKTGRFEVWFNLPSGKTGLGAGENTALTRTRASADSFFGVQPGLGFGAGVGYHWLLRKGDVRDEFGLRLRFFGDYDALSIPGTVVRNDGRDHMEASWARTYLRENSELEFGLRMVHFQSAGSSTNGVRTDLDSSTNIHAWVEHQLELNERNTLRYRLYYQDRDSLDNFNLGLATRANTDLGDRLLWTADLTRESSEHGFWNFGVNGLWSDGTSLNGLPRAGTRRDEVYGHVGYTRRTNNGQGWSFDVDIGVSSDALDHRLVGRYFISL